MLDARRSGRTAFEFSDLVSVRRVTALLEEGVPLRRIRRSLESLRESIPELDRPLEALRPAPGRAGEVVARHQGLLVETDGQLVLELGSESAPDERIAPLAPRQRETQATERQEARGVADAWFEQGCRLDTDRSTYAEAIYAYEQAVAADPEYADAWCNLGTVFYNQERRARARECFERTLRLEPHHLEGHLNMAALLEEAGEPGAALRHYKRALAIDPLCADTHVSLALVYGRLCLPGRAREHWRRYLQLDPSGGWADVARRHLAD